MPKHPLPIVAAFLLVCVSIVSAAEIRPITFPVDGKHSFRNDFAEPRALGAREHLGIDIIADKMTPVVAAVDGEVTYVVSPQASWGYSITVRDGEGYQYRYLHLNNDTPRTDDGAGGEANAYAPGITRGASVIKGQLIGWVGDSGNAEGTVSHLHFEIREPSRIAINPYETLLAADTASARDGSSATTSPSAGGEEATYLFTRSLSLGSRGEDVRQLQLLLEALGYFNHPVITGYFGPITRAAVVKFQKAEHINPVGILGPLTRGVLNGV